MKIDQEQIRQDAEDRIADLQALDTQLSQLDYHIQKIHEVLRFVDMLEMTFTALDYTGRQLVQGEIRAALEETKTTRDHLEKALKCKSGHAMSDATIGLAWMARINEQPNK